MRVVMIDDHEMIHMAVRGVLALDPDIQLVGEGYCGQDFRRLVAQHQPEIVLLDLSMPEQPDPNPNPLGERFNPPAAIRWCQAQYPQVRIVVLSQYIDLTLVDLDVAGYLSKSDVNVTTNLPALLRAMAAGQKKTSPTITETLLANPLTDRQIEALREIVSHPNRTQAEHAAALGLSESGLKKHLGSIYDRLHVTNLTAAVVLAQWAGYIGFTPPSET